MRAAVVAELHEDPFVEPTRYALTARLSHVGARLRAKIVLEDFDGRKLGTRELGGRDCEELVPAMAWVIALAVGPLIHPPVDLPEVDMTEPVAPTPPVAPVGIATPLPALEVIPPRPAPPRLFWLVGVGEVAAINAGAAIATPGFSLSVAAVVPHFSMGLELRGDLPAVREHERRASISTYAAHGHARALRALSHHRGVQRPQRPSASIARASPTRRSCRAALGGRLAVELPVYRHLWVRVHADVLASLTNLSFYSAIERFYRVSGALGWALLLQFP